jgi:DNA (cytosine-5)-methyltransferase 1
MNFDSIRVVELFAGVGGFRLGLERCSPLFDIVWANQWEPDRKNQYAFQCYEKHFGHSQTHICADIAAVKRLVPKHDLLVGGFPCQDYSVARTGAQGIDGKKGVLWWTINDIIRIKKPRYILLENVDRLLKSPSNQRGRDFGIILRCLADNGYSAEWRVINAADYGQAQRRRRTYIFAFRNDTALHTQYTNYEPFQWLVSSGFFAGTFPNKIQQISLSVPYYSVSPKQYEDLTAVSTNFQACFENTGVMSDYSIYTIKTEPIYEPQITLEQIRLRSEVAHSFFLNGESLEKIKYQKGAKKIERIKPNGEPYFFTEGAVPFPDYINHSARTMLTSEATINRSTHVIEDFLTGKYRLLTPTECERLNGFPDNWTDTGMPQRQRYFTMGNALVVPLITRMGEKLLEMTQQPISNTMATLWRGGYSLS